MRMDQRHWSRQILHELSRLQGTNGDGANKLVWLSDLGVSMLGNTDSAVGLQWVNAVQELRREGMIQVDRAGYVTLTPRGLEGARNVAARGE